MDDAELLGKFLDSRSEPAFTELVRRHLPLVQGAALRRVGGDRHLADDVTQQVFCDLARKAPILRNRTHLAGWLFTSTRFAAAQAVRSDIRRRKYEQEAMKMPATAPDASADWEQLRPVIDDALDELSEPDREAVLMRFFEERSHAEVGQRLAISAEAARMRVDRAMDKLRAALTHRGVASTTAGLALILAGQSVLGATPESVTRFSAGALAGRAAGGGLAAWKIAAAVAVAAGGVAVGTHLKSGAMSAPVQEPLVTVAAAPSKAPPAQAEAVRTAVPKPKDTPHLRQVVELVTSSLALRNAQDSTPEQRVARLAAVVDLTAAQTDLAKKIFQDERDALHAKQSSGPTMFGQYLLSYERIAQRELWEMFTPDQRQIWSQIPQNRGGGKDSQVAVEHRLD